MEGRKNDNDICIDNKSAYQMCNAWKRIIVLNSYKTLDNTDINSKEINLNSSAMQLRGKRVGIPLAAEILPLLSD